MRTKDLDLAQVEAAFQVEQTEREAAASGPLVPTSTAALAASTPAPSKPACSFCGIPGHAQDDCFKYKTARESTLAAVADKRRARREENKARKASTSSTSPTTSTSANAASTPQQAKALSASLRLVSSSITSADTFWIADTGATSHMSPHREWFVEYRPHRIPVRVANDAIVYSAGIGAVVLAPTDPSMNRCRLSHVLHVPDLQNNLLSVLHLVTAHRFRIEIEGDQALFLQQGNRRLTASIRDNTAFMDVSTESIEASALASREPRSRQLWHRRLCHIGMDKIDQVIKNSLADGLVFDTDSSDAPLCVPCVHGKHHKAPFPRQASHRSETPFERIHSDLHEVPVLTLSGFRYWITFIDDCTRYGWVYVLKKKSDAFDAFTQFKAFIETQYSGLIRFFRQDKGGEFIGAKWDDLFATTGIQRENTITATPQQNGVAERKNRILAELIVALLNESRLPKTFWAEALATVNKVLNMLPSAL
jgi:transposase InsO family protein